MTQERKFPLNSNNIEYATLDYVKIEAKLKVIMSMLSNCSNLSCYGICSQKKVKHITQLKNLYKCSIKCGSFLYPIVIFSTSYKGFQAAQPIIKISYREIEIAAINNFLSEV